MIRRSDLVASKPASRAALELTILMPCLNEAETVATCVRKARGFLERTGIRGEVLVADNGSSDGSPELARGAGARVVAVALKGYGNALIGGIDAARGRFVIMADADDSYDFSQLDAFVDCLRAGNTMVVGHRFRGGIMPGSMPALHRYLGNPLLSFVGRLFFSSRIGDFHCGLRGVDRVAALQLGLSAPGMEFASEMIVKATLAGWRIAEVPTALSPDGRSRPPHLRSWRDGWRHLRYLLMMSPRWLMLYPGLCLIGVGIAAELAILRGPVLINGVGFDIHTMLYAAGATILGVQLVLSAC
jgi:glycosyltransferase involved in cell wall biosynthesis